MGFDLGTFPIGGTGEMKKTGQGNDKKVITYLIFKYLNFQIALIEFRLNGAKLLKSSPKRKSR